MTVTPGEGLALEHNGHVTRLKWHRLRRRMSDPLFSLQVMEEGFRLGASMELDLRVRGDGGFVVLHDARLEGETTGSGAVAETSRAMMAEVEFKDVARPLIFTEELAAMMKSAHPDALLQFDMKDDFETIGAAGVAHLAEHFSRIPASIIISGGSMDLIAAFGEKLPGLLRGIDPTDRLYRLYRQTGAADIEGALLAAVRGPARPDTVYLYWNLVLELAKQGLDLVALCHAEGCKVDTWTYTLKDPAGGFSDAEWEEFRALMQMRPDQITTDESLATEAAWRKRVDRAD